MRFVNRLWYDQRGAVLSAELVTVATVAVIGLTVGLKMTSTAINEELGELAFAVRSLDQSYAFAGQCSCRSWTAGSCYQQRPVELSLRELCGIRNEASEQLAPPMTEEIPPSPQPPLQRPPAPQPGPVESPEPNTPRPRITPPGEIDSSAMAASRAPEAASVGL